MFFYDMSQRGDCSLYEYLYRCIRHDIAHGIIAPGEKLPSKRNLAKHLGISLITVEAAYQQLAAEGYIRSRERCGYYACDLAPAARVKPDSSTAGECGLGCENENAAGEARGQGESETLPSSSPVHAAHSRGLTDQTINATSPENTAAEPAFASQSVNGKPLLADFTYSTLATESFPYATWARTVRKTLSDESAASLAEAASAAGSPQLRRAIANHLREFRGMSVQPDQIVVGAGSQTLYQLVVQLLGRDRAFAIEDPGYPLLTRMYRQQNVSVSRIPLDADGIDVAALERSDASIAHIMPSHQFPTGIVTTAKRRRELLNWAREDDRYLIEDDYDAEFRMAGRPIPPLFSIDAAERVLYLNSFAKSLGAAFRMAYLVLPPRLARRFRAQLGFYANTVSPLDQLALTRFIESGSYERHVNRLRTQARKTQDALVSALNARFGNAIAFEGLDNGLHFIAQLESLRSEQDLAAAALAQGVRIAPLSRFCESKLQNDPEKSRLEQEPVGTGGRARVSTSGIALSPDSAAKGWNTFPAPCSNPRNATGTDHRPRSGPRNESDATRHPQFILRSDAIDADSTEAIAKALASAWL